MKSHLDKEAHAARMAKMEWDSRESQGTAYDEDEGPDLSE